MKYKTTLATILLGLATTQTQAQSCTELGLDIELLTQVTKGYTTKLTNSYDVHTDMVKKSLDSIQGFKDNMSVKNPSFTDEQKLVQLNYDHNAKVRKSSLDMNDEGINLDGLHSNLNKFKVQYNSLNCSIPLKKVQF